MALIYIDYIGDWEMSPQTIASDPGAYNVLASLFNSQHFPLFEK